jgi:hypothetical protein
MVKVQPPGSVSIEEALVEQPEPPNQPPVWQEPAFKAEQKAAFAVNVTTSAPVSILQVALPWQKASQVQFPESAFSIPK